jgi:tetratricopeptide (TPR) repeat protein
LDERAITRFNVSDKAGAIRDLKRSAAVASTESERLTFESVWLEMNGELQASMQRSRRALELNPSNGRAYFELAYVYQELPFEPDMQEAIKNYSLALEHGYHRAYVTVFNRGFAKEAAHDFAGAIEDYRLTMKMNPYFSQVCGLSASFYGVLMSCACLLFLFRLLVTALA